jgi:hypothetical protein
LDVSNELHILNKICKFLLSRVIQLPSSIGQFFLGELTITQHVKIFLALYRIRKFVTVPCMEQKRIHRFSYKFCRAESAKKTQA